MLATFIDALGSGMFSPFSMLYFRIRVGLPLATIGLALSIAMLSTLLMLPLTGLLVDRLGARYVVMSAQFVQGIGFLGYLLVTDFMTLVAFACLASSGQAMFWAAYFPLVAQISAPEDRERWYGLVGALRAAGVGLGGLLAGVIVAALTKNTADLAVLCDGLSFLLAAGLVYTGVHESPHRMRPIGPPGYQAVIRDRPFLLLIGANTCFALCRDFFYLAVPVYFTLALKLPIWFVGVIFACTTTFIATMQPVMVPWVEPFRRTRALMAAGGIWCLWSATSALTLALPRLLLIPTLFLVVCLYGVAQMIHTPTSNALAIGSSPEALRGR